MRESERATMSHAMGKWSWQRRRYANAMRRTFAVRMIDHVRENKSLYTE